MTETTPRREATKARLVRAAVLEFAQRGIDATSVEQICDTAGFTRGAFYSNFSSKDDLCVAVEVHLAEVLRDAFRASLANLPPDLDASGIVPTLLNQIEGAGEVRIVQMEMELRALRHPEFAERVVSTRATLMPAFIDIANYVADVAGVEFVTDAHDVIHALESVFYSPLSAVDPQRTRTVICTIVQHLTRPKPTSAEPTP